MDFQVTIRYGKNVKRYFSMTVEAQDVREALHFSAAEIPVELAPEADLVELRVAPDFEKAMPPSQEP